MTFSEVAKLSWATHCQKEAADWHDEYRRLRGNKYWVLTASVCSEKAEYWYREARQTMGIE